MIAGENAIAYGPVPSRRLGRSLGINNIPPKICTYSCVYCQIGRTTRMHSGRLTLYEPDKVAAAVHSKMDAAIAAGEVTDYLTFVPDGEPTVDENLGREIELLRPLGTRIAVITNGSLISRRDVRRDLAQADWVSLKVDAVTEKVWRKIDRASRSLQLAPILEGMIAFSETFAGDLVTETMLVEGVNDDAECIEEIADFLSQLKPAMAYVAIPIRPPAEAWVCPPGEQIINQAYHILNARVERVECVIGYEDDAFACTGDVEQDLLSVTAVHPMRWEAVNQFLVQADADWSVVDRLVARDQLLEIDYGGQTFYLKSRHEQLHANNG